MGVFLIGYSVLHGGPSGSDVQLSYLPFVSGASIGIRARIQRDYSSAKRATEAADWVRTGSNSVSDTKTTNKREAARCTRKTKTVTLWKLIQSEGVIFHWHWWSWGDWYNQTEQFDPMRRPVYSPPFVITHVCHDQMTELYGILHSTKTVSVITWQTSVRVHPRRLHGSSFQLVDDKHVKILFQSVPAYCIGWEIHRFDFTRVILLAQLLLRYVPI